MQDTSPKKPSLYDTDFYAWANQQAALLLAGRLCEADIANIAEEIESMGRSEKRELVSRLQILLLHLLNWRYQPKRRGKSWRSTIKVQRIELSRHLRDNPSLTSRMAEAIADAYEVASVEAERETSLDGSTFPTACPWGYDEIIGDGYWPDE